jgi:hypothetical protein
MLPEGVTRQDLELALKLFQKLAKLQEQKKPPRHRGPVVLTVIDGGKAEGLSPREHVERLMA